MVVVIRRNVAQAIRPTLVVVDSRKIARDHADGEILPGQNSSGIYLLIHRRLNADLRCEHADPLVARRGSEFR